MSQRRLPAGIYWRRRLLVLAVLIALVWMVLRVNGAAGGDSPKAEPTASATPSAIATAPVAPVATDGIVEVDLTSASTACDPEKVRITPSVRADQLTKGPVNIGLTVSSTAAAACTLTPADAELVAVISANGTPVWDSTVCKMSLLAEPVVISPRWATLAIVQWSGRGSGANCSGKEGYATPGKYTVQLGTLGGEPGKTTFTLDPKPKATPTPTPTPAPVATPKPAQPTATPVPPKTTTKPADQ